MNATTVHPQPAPRYFEGINVSFHTGQIPPRGHPAWGEATLARLAAHALKRGDLAVLVGHGPVHPNAGFAMDGLPLISINLSCAALRVWLQAADIVVWAKGIRAIHPGAPIGGLEHIRALHQVAREKNDFQSWLNLGRMAQAIANGTAETRATATTN